MRKFTLSAAALAAVVLAGVLLATPASPANAVKATNDGHKHISVSQTASGKIVVKWLPTLGVKYFLVKTSSTPDMSQNVKSYKVSKKKTTVTVAPTKYAVAGTGNYTFVRVYAVKKGKVGVSPYKQVRMKTAAPAAGLSAETVATFNVKTAELPEVSGHKWTQRIGAVASQIQQSNAAVVALEEAGSPGTDYKVVVTKVDGHNTQSKDFYWQFEQLRDAVGGTYQLADSEEYAPGALLGKEGTRILYDTSKVTMLSQGFFAPSAVDKYLRYVPWAQFQDNATGKKFYFIAAHLDNRDSQYKLRLKQIATVIAKVKEFSATGEQVILAGDMNSNIYSKPYNAVDQALIKAGFFDSYATSNNVNEFYVTFNDFSKPKKSASRTDYIMTYGQAPGSYSYKDWIVRSGTIPSDHYMQTATVPIG